MTVLKFTQDGVGLVSGSEDSSVIVWSVSRYVHAANMFRSTQLSTRLLDDDARNELVAPFCILSDHTLAITDLVCGVGSFPTGRILSSSKDHSVKARTLHLSATILATNGSLQLWDVGAKCLLTTFLFPQIISCISLEVTERAFFAGSTQGTVYQTNLFRYPEGKDTRNQIEAIGGAGVSDVIRPDEGNEKRRMSAGCVTKQSSFKMNFSYRTAALSPAWPSL